MSSGDILATKLKHGFDHLDVDGDGRLDENDHVAMGQRLARSLGHPEGSPAEQRLVEMYRRLWREMLLPNVRPGENAVSRDDFVAACTRVATQEPETAQAALGGAAEVFMAIVDTDADGRVSPAEFATFMRGHCPELADSDITFAFGHLDLNGDGYLSADEFRQATVQYWSSSDPDAPGNWWLGPIPGVTG